MITNCILPHISDFIGNHGIRGHANLVRMAFVVAVPFGIVTRAIDSAIGVIVGAGAICTGGMHKRTYKLADSQLMRSNFILATPFTEILRVMHPLNNVITAKEEKGHGLLTNIANEKLTGYAQTCSKSKNIFKAHLLSRATYVVLALVSLVTRAVDGVIGVVAGIGSLVTLGKFVSLNTIAYKGLQAPGVIQDIFNCAVKTINPWASLKA